MLEIGVYKGMVTRGIEIQHV